MKILIVFIVLQTSLSAYAEDMQQYLKDTQTMVRQGKYKEALERHIWFHDHALEHNPAMAGVRLSFALEYWKSLGNLYPPAKLALEETRNSKTDQILQGEGNFQLFLDVAALNRTLAEGNKTATLFEYLDREDPALAQRCWDVAKEYVIAAHRYSLAQKYIGDYVQAFNRVKAMYDSNTAMYDNPKIGGAQFKQYNESRFVREILQLIEVAVALSDEREAGEIQAKALVVVDDTRLRGDVSKYQSNNRSFQELAGRTRNNINRPIPDFSLPDQNGKTWTFADLKGKTTLINIWATWCGPCRLELPLLQKLYEQIKDRDDIQLITLNVDADRSVVEPFLKESKFSFPSLYAKSFMDGFTGPRGIPTTWISDITGTIRFEVLGFGGDGSEWIQQTLKQIDRVREGSGQIDVDEVRFADVAPTSVNLTGLWNSNDGGMYFIRQIGNDVWWYGRSKDDGKTWSNVFKGTLDGGTVIGQWADVPHGSYLNSGIMILKIESENSLTATQKTGGFSGSQWTRIIPDSRESGEGAQSTAKAKVETPVIRDNSEQVLIGSLKWEISEDASGKILASGDGPIHLKDVSITERSDAPRRLIDKRIMLTDEFDIGMAEYPATNPDEKAGFGITAKRTDIQSFSWEWFNIRGKRAVKLQESGELGIDLKKVNDGWEITRTEFITDVSFRIIRFGVDPPGSPPYWRVKIFKGSNITWPSTINGEVVPN